MGTPSATIAFSNLGTSATQVLAADSTRGSIEFHNPNLTASGTNVSVLVYPVNDQTGTAITPSFSAPGGGYVILGGADRTFRGTGVQLAWYARAESGTTNGLTMTISQGTIGS